MGCSQADLITVGGIAGSGALGDDTLGQFAFHGLADGFVDVARTSDTHGLIHIASAAQRVADGTAHAGGCPAKRLNFGRMVMCFVFEHQQPFFDFAIYIHIHKHTAGVVFLRHFHIVEVADFALVLTADGGHVHQRDGFPAAMNIVADLNILVKCLLQLVVELVGGEGDVVQLRLEGGVAAVVAPIGVQHLDFRLRGISFFFILEIILNEQNILERHG